MLAGGGTKAAYAAGVLEVLLPTLDPVRQRPFARVEATSSGIFNAAMMAAGQDAGEIADNWLRLRPLRALSPNWLQLPLLFWGRSLLTWNRFMRNVVKRPSGWGLTFPVRATDGRAYHFNAYNVSDQRLVSFDELDETRFKACIALPRWFPSEMIDHQRHVDAVFATDSNAAAVLDVDGLDEIWVIWTVDVSGTWHNGWVSNYFRILEQSAAASYRRERKHILAHDFIPAAHATEHDKVLFEIAGDVPAHYLFTFFGRTVRNAVKQGSDDATRYLEDHAKLWSRP